MDKRNMFEVTVPSGHIFKGEKYLTEGATRNLVCFTGMGEYSQRYARLAAHFNSKGINVYVLDLMGQGHNVEKVEDQEHVYPGAFEDNVDAAYVKVQELRKEGKPVYLFGHSMGSFMTQRYLTKYPGTVDAVIICGSNAGQKFLMNMGRLLAVMLTPKSKYDKKAGILEKLSIGAYVNSVKDHKIPCEWISYNDENVHNYCKDPWCGAPTTRGFWREALGGICRINSRRYYKHLSPHERILIIAGEDDPVGQYGKGPRKLYKRYLHRRIKDVKLVLYPKMRHEIHFEDDYEKVYEEFSSFLLAR